MYVTVILSREVSERYLWYTFVCRSGSGMDWPAHIRHCRVPAYALEITPYSECGEPECDGYFTAGWYVQPLRCIAIYLLRECIGALYFGCVYIDNICQRLLMKCFSELCVQ